MKNFAKYLIEGMRKIILILSGLILLSCEKVTNIQTKSLDLEEFIIDIPITWTYCQQQGYDSFIGQFKITEKEVVNFDFGWYSNTLKVDNSTHNFIIDYIDGKKATIVRPKDFQRGTTGVYFDSLETTKTVKFQLSGIDLSKSNQQLLIKSIESLKFKD